jgi:hypothetical protein
MRPGHQFDYVSLLIRDGFGDARIAALTGIPRSTARDWRRKGRPGLRQRTAALDCPRCGGAIPDESSYAYLQGVYLGDGCLSEHPRTYRLRIVLDARYPAIIHQAMEAMAAMRGPTSRRVNLLDRGGCVEISAYWQHWPCLFPQHGSGRKHSRSILLVPWQARIAAAHPQMLLRGLIHSDGCRVTNRVRGGKYSHPRYFFTTAQPTSWRSSEELATSWGSAIATPSPIPSRSQSERMSPPSIASSDRRPDIGR